MLLEFKEVVKRFGNVIALHRVTFSMEKDRRIIVIGPNGSGKSTLLKVAAGILKPSSGTVKRDVFRVGYIPDQIPNLDRIYTVMDLVWHFEKLFNFNFYREYIKELSLQINFRENFNALSKGEKKKVLLSIIFSMKPDLYLLDEPFVGLDVSSKFALSQWLENKNYLITTHEIDFIPKNFDRIYIIENGKFVDSTKTSPEIIISYNRPTGERIYNIKNNIWIKLND